jgi:hypothetical protein
MPDTTNRRFAVRARDADHHHAKLVAEPSFEAAAVAYMQDADLAEGQDLSIVVRDLESGHEHCFRIDLETGETAAC